jgi:hypothetical protein
MGRFRTPARGAFGEVRVGGVRNPSHGHSKVEPASIGTNLNTDFHQRELRLERTGQSGRPAL